MSVTRRGALLGAGLASSVSGAALAAQRPFQRIAVEEAFTTADVVAEARKMTFAPRSMAGGVTVGPLLPLLLDLGAGRIAKMDADGIDKQVLLLSAPGVQIFDAPTGSALARAANDQLSDAVRAAPTRLAGLAALAPQDPAQAARELERAIHTLGLKGAVINSHTHGEYLDDAKFWPILEAAEALDAPIYLHPRDPAPQMAGPLDIPGFAVGWGFGVEAGTHALRLIGAGVFDRFPKLRIVLGHMGEGIPFLLRRIDNRFVWEGRVIGGVKLRRPPSDYFKANFTITTSGMNYPAPLAAALAELGAETILFAADYPFEVQADAVAEMDAMALSDVEKRRIYQTNAERVFRL